MFVFSTIKSCRNCMKQYNKSFCRLFYILFEVILLQSFWYNDNEWQNSKIKVDSNFVTVIQKFSWPLTREEEGSQN